MRNPLLSGKNVLPTYGRFSHARSHMMSSAAPHTDAISNASRPEQVCDTQKFTDERLQLFKKLAEEGYNLYRDPA